MTHIFTKQDTVSHLLSHIWIYHIHMYIMLYMWYICVYMITWHIHTYTCRCCWDLVSLHTPKIELLVLSRIPPTSASWVPGDRHAAPHLTVIYWVSEKTKFWNSIIFHDNFTSGLLLQSLLQKNEVPGDLQIFHKNLIPPSISLKRTLNWDVSVGEGPQDKRPIATTISRKPSLCHPSESVTLL